jgi:ring-1,2-phenylacetyl-CoA epoxidase subunit PaaE
MLTYTLKVIDIIIETEDAVTLSFKQPALRKVKYLSGQYLTLIFRINGRRYLRPYSFSSSPDIDHDLKITVKRVIGGIISNHIIDKVKIGDLVEVLEPMGDFILDNNNLVDKHLILWGSGSGITPLYSILKSILHKNLCSRVTLFYGNRSHETTIFKEQINNLQQQFAEKLTVWNFYTKAFVTNSMPYVVQGRIEPKKILAILEDEIDIENTVHYICGPIGLKDSIKSTLVLSGVNVENVFNEDFEVIRNPKEFENIATQNVSILKNEQLISFEVTKGKSILEAGLDTNIDFSYSCQTGDCLLCKGYLKNGEVKMIGAKKASLLEDKECLLCCSFPLTDNVEIVIK